MSSPRPALHLGDAIAFDGGEHQVVGLVGTTVRLRSDAGGEQVVLAGHLMAAPDFALLEGRARPSVEPFGLLQAMPDEAVAEAERWRSHIVEVETGLAPAAAPGTAPREGYAPQTTSLADRQRAKAAELGVTARTVEAKRARYASQGLWGLVDQRAARTFDVAGQADARLVEVLRELIDEETTESTGTRSRLMRRAVKRAEERHGAGVVPMPGRSAFYALIGRLAVGRHTFGSAATRRQTANRPKGAFTPTFASRPGQQVQIDSTPIDVMVLGVDGVAVRADLTIAVDVATRTIAAAVLRPVGTKAVGASLLLAKMLVPEPMRPGWAEALRMSVSRLPHQALMDIDARMREAAARPVIVPEQVVIDHGKVFVSDTFSRACERLGISIQPARKDTPTDKGVVEATFSAIKTLFAQNVAGFKGANTQLRGRDVAGVWMLEELQDFLDEWLIVGWQHRPHDALRDPHASRIKLTPNERYAALVAVAGYLPITLDSSDYLELLPVKWRTINAYGSGSRTGPTTAPSSARSAASTPGSRASAGSGRSTTTPTSSRRSTSARPRAGSPRPGRTRRWSPDRSPTSPGTTRAAWPWPAARARSPKPTLPARWKSCSPAPSTAPTAPAPGSSRAPAPPRPRTGPPSRIPTRPPPPRPLAAAPRPPSMSRPRPRPGPRWCRSGCSTPTPTPKPRGGYDQPADRAR